MAGVRSESVGGTTGAVPLALGLIGWKRNGAGASAPAPLLTTFGVVIYQRAVLRGPPKPPDRAPPPDPGAFATFTISLRPSND